MNERVPPPERPSRFRLVLGTILLLWALFTGGYAVLLVATLVGLVAGADTSWTEVGAMTLWSATLAILFFFWLRLGLPLTRGQIPRPGSRGRAFGIGVAAVGACLVAIGATQRFDLLVILGFGLPALVGGAWFAGLAQR